jgi:RNA polymerase sigma-70 factor (ECF subfamily)
MSPIEGERYRNAVAAEATPVPPTQGEGAAEATLVQQFRERLRLFALRRLRDRTAAEDVAQETLRRVLEAWRAGRIENPSALPAFVFQTAQHICLQHFRTTKREGRALLRLSGEETSERGTHPLAALIGEEQRAAVREALNRLSVEDQELLRMVYYENVETVVVAERLRVTPGTLRVRKHRVLARLGELLRAREV